MASVAAGDHPAQIAARTYVLSLSLSLAPSLLPFVTSAKARAGGFRALKAVLARELGWSGFAFAMTVGVGGGSALQQAWNTWGKGCSSCGRDAQAPNCFRHGRLVTYVASLPDSSRSFIANALSAALAITLLQSRRSVHPSGGHHGSSIPMTLPLEKTGQRTSPTLDLTLLLFVRAMDSVVRTTILPSANVNEEGSGSETSTKTQTKRQKWTNKLDALVFWACSARIMWCFFYEPARLPRSYNKWIMSLANIDPRILGALRAIRSGAVSYTKGQADPIDLVSSLSEDLGYSAAWGDFSRIPAYGGPKAAVAWKAVGVLGRDGLGGIPCELVHGGVTGGSCTANAAIRGTYAFVDAIAIYLPVHALPILLTQPSKFLSISELSKTFMSILRSSAFLSTFVSSIWVSVCLTRTLLLARLFPSISHDFWDGAYGCTFAGSLICGGSIWIEQGKRRGEMALYVLPRALRACLSKSWIRSGRRSVKVIERLVFILSLATLLTASAHRTDSLRGLSRWALTFIMKGPNAYFWKRKRDSPGVSKPASST